MTQIFWYFCCIIGMIIWELYIFDKWKESGTGKGSKLRVIRWEIGKLHSNFNCNDMLFAHAWCGCDITSALCKKGKFNYNFCRKIYRRFIQKLNFRQPTFAYFMTWMLSVFQLLECEVQGKPQLLCAYIKYLSIFIVSC